MTSQLDAIPSTALTTTRLVAINKTPRLLDQLQLAARGRGDSQPTAQVVLSWARAL